MQIENWKPGIRIETRVGVRLCHLREKRSSRSLGRHQRELLDRIELFLHGRRSAVGVCVVVMVVVVVRAAFGDELRRRVLLGGRRSEFALIDSDHYHNEP